MKKKPSVPAAPTPADTGLEALAWAVASGSAAKVIRRVGQKRRRRVAAGAAGVLCLLLAAVWFRSVPPPAALPPHSLVTLPTRKLLPDGSIVDLKDGARLAVAFTPEFRRIDLKKGEAHFAVARNNARPFIVRAGGVEFRAVGTAFAVQLGAHAVELVVTEGRVAVVSAAPSDSVQPTAPPLFVDAGSRVSVDLAPAAAAPAVQAMTPAEATDRLAWRIPLLHFSGTPLAAAIPLFNAHTTGARLRLDPSLDRLEVSGNVRADDTDTLLLLLRNEFGIESEPRPDGTLYLHRP